MRFASINPNDEIKVVSIDEFNVIDGHLKFNRQSITLNAAQAAQE